MSKKIQRDFTSLQVSLQEDGGNYYESDAFDMRSFSGLMIVMPDGWTSASIGFKVARHKDDTFVPLYDADGNLVQVTTPSANQAYSSPAEVFGVHWGKLWSQSSGTGVDQGSDRTFTLLLKG